jgi:ABC-type antimicrobial peptide transport system permease subunit
MQNTVRYPLAAELKTHYAGHFEHIVVARHTEEHILSAGTTKLSRQGQFIEPAGPEMLTLKMLRGSRAGLTDPHSILLSASTARALFGDANPLNKTLRLDNQLDAKVTGVYEDLPRNTEFYEVEFFAPFELYAIANPGVKEQGWDNWFLQIYAQLKPGADLSEVNALVKDAQVRKLQSMEGFGQADAPMLYLLPMRDWHLRGNYDLDDQGPLQLVWLIGLVGAFVLLLACINFMNLSTARSEKRAKEVGIRKTMGSRRGQLIRQFFSESLLVVGLAFGLALLLVSLALPGFNDLSAKQIAIPWASPYLWLGSLCFVALTSLLAGSYPALYLSAFQPIKVLKGTFRVGWMAALPRRVLVVVQFAITVTLMISTVIVYRQVEHAQNRPIGYSREGLLMLEMKTADFAGKFELLRTELLRTGLVHEVAQSRSSVTSMKGYNGGFFWKGREVTKGVSCATQMVSPEYGKTVGWQFTGGRDFVRGLTSDSAGIVINESFARLMGRQNPIGEVVRWAPGNREPAYYTILGVIKDMVVISPYKSAIASVYFLKGTPKWINIRIHPQVSVAKALPGIEAVFKRIVPAVPFDYQFADQEYAAKFADEERIGTLAAFFASLAIFISCLGLFGLASFTAEQRTKEIGIRKVLGASVVTLWRLLSKDFVYLVAVGFVIAAPLAYYGLHTWLERYEYRTTLSWTVFAGTGLAALLLTLLTVSAQAAKAALQNPVKSLRTE